MVLISGIERPLFHEIPDKIEMAFANRDVQRGRVVIFAGKQLWTTLDQFLHTRQIAIPARHKHVPDIRSGRDNAIVKLDGASLFHFSWLYHGISLYAESTRSIEVIRLSSLSRRRVRFY